MKAYLGIDVGSVTTKFAVLNDSDELIYHLYLLTRGSPIEMLQQGLKKLSSKLDEGVEISGVATTGSGRSIAGVVVGADLVKNEITSHAVAALHYFPEIQTVIEIGGQDSKIIIIRDGIVTDFGMNTVCAAGTGSFLDHQAQRLNMNIEEFGRRSLKSTKPTHIAGRCTVFAESDMIHKQQMGHKTDDILYGLCQALVRNYLNDVGLGKEIKTPIIFQGGVAFNQGIAKALKEEMGKEVIIPPNPEVMGAIGAALLAHEEMAYRKNGSSFKGFGVSDIKYQTSSFECKACPTLCEIAQLSAGGKVLTHWGGRCDLWEENTAKKLKRAGKR